MKNLVFVRIIVLLMSALFFNSYVINGQTTAQMPTWKRELSATINGSTMPNAFSGGDSYVIRGKPFLIDIDGDNDLDAYVGSADKGVYFFENIGTRFQPHFRLRSTNHFSNDKGVPYPYTSPAAVDLDDDGDYDMLVGYGNDGGFGGTLLYFKNTGNKTTPQWQFVQDSFAKIDVFDYSSPYPYDFDGDGDFDLLVGGGFGDLFYVENTGTRKESRWGSVINKYGISNSTTIDVSWKAAPAVWDYNGDKKPDLFIGNDEGFLTGFVNISADTTRSPQYHRYRRLPFPVADVNFGWLNYVAPAFGDLNGDGQLDLVVSEQFGNSNYYENTTTINDTFPRFTWKSMNIFSETLDFGSLFLGRIQSKDINNDNIMDVLIKRNNGSYSLMLSDGAGKWQVKTEHFLGLSKPKNTGEVYLVKNNDKVEIAIVYYDSLKYYMRLTDSVGIPRWRYRGSYKHRFNDYTYTPSLTVGDIDGNGQDDFVGYQSSANKYYVFKNCSTADNLCWRLDSLDMPVISYIVRYDHLGLVDLDKDGDLDMLGLNTIWKGLWLKNIGNRTQPRFQYATAPELRQLIFKSEPLNVTYSLAFGNAFNSGGLDAILCANDGGLIAFKSFFCSGTPPTLTSTGTSCLSFLTDTIPRLTWTHINSLYEVRIEEVPFYEGGQSWTYCTTTPSLLPNFTPRMGYLYRWFVRTVSDSCGQCKSPYSEPRYFYMRPKITTQGILCDNDSLYLFANFSGSYQSFHNIEWFYNGVLIPSAKEWSIFVKKEGRYHFRILRDDVVEDCGVLSVVSDTFIVAKPSVRIVQTCKQDSVIIFKPYLQNFANSYRIDWFNSNSSIPIATADSLSLKRSGNETTRIYARITAYSCNNGRNLIVNSDTVRVNCTTSTKNLPATRMKPKFKPNPASQFIKIEWEDLNTEGVEKTIVVVNMVGSIMRQYKTMDNTLLINVSDLPIGFYILETHLKNYAVKTVQKFVVAR